MVSSDPRQHLENIADPPIPYDQHYCQKCKKKGHCLQCCPRLQKQNQALYCLFCDEKGHLQQCCKKRKHHLNAQAYQTTCVKQPDHSNHKGMDASVQNKLDFWSLKKEISNATKEEVKIGNRVKDELFKNQVPEFLNFSTAAKVVIFAANQEDLTWFRVSSGSIFSDAESIKKLVGVSKGFGCTYLDKATNKVEGLWVCHQERVPESS